MDFVALELGAMNPFVAPTYVPAPPSMTVGIGGTTFVEDAGNYTYTANPANGTGPYTYRWEWSENATNWTVVSTAQTYQTFISELDEPYFWVRVTAIDSNGGSASNAKKINIFIGGCSGTLC
jgi:hypothetical protein